MNTKVAVFLGLCLLLASFLTEDRSEASSITSTDIVFEGLDFQDGLHYGSLSSSDGLTMESDAFGGSYISPVIEAPVAFNAVVPQWLADIPNSADLHILLRTAPDDENWSEWFGIHPQPDWMLPEDLDTVGEMITVPAADGTHQYAQFAVNFSRQASLSEPILSQMRLTFIDSTEGPSAEEMIAQQEAIDSIKPESPESGYPKPPVVSRSVWCTDPACNYSHGLEYQNVTHLIIHHTVSSNSSSNWAATVRAIWHFHTFTREWGDIGYNYLVDMNGVIYEGHNGGDDVVGTHAAGANAGSMALSFIGTFTTPDYNPPGIAPPQAMRNAAAELLAWKADQKNINVYDASRLPNLSWGLPHLMGHRDVYGTTECPGTQLHNIIPWLRDEISRRIGFVSPHIYVDEMSGAFSKGPNVSWYVPPKNCGFNGHSFYTWSVNNPGQSVNWGEWRPNLPSSDHYEVEVYAPYCVTGRGETNGATYRITHANGTNTAKVSHQASVGTWMSLGTYYFNAGNSGLIRLTDLTDTDSGLGVWFDAIRFRPSNALPAPTVTNLAPETMTWHNQRDITFNWAISNEGAVSNTKLQVATDQDFDNLVVDKDFSGPVTSYNHTFDQDYARLYWRVKLTAIQGGTITSSSSYFGIDTQPPSSSINLIFVLEDNSYVLSWSGQDAGVGIAAYNLEYREEGGAWISWLTNYHATAATFISPNLLKHYEFRSQAVDGVGNTEPFPSASEVNTRDAIPLEAVIMYPLVAQD
ncbi:MAG: N-acetylmuramoyl-L-alanine amidase [Chloroflexota bacterium]|jgi:hypothetical protein